MPILTAGFFLALFAYIAAWLSGRITGDFAVLLFWASSITGCYWLADRFYFAPKRRQAAAQLEQNDQERRAKLTQQGITQIDGDIAQAKTQLLMQPWWLDWTAGLFPVLLAVFLLRSFAYEPFKIPSGSMTPTLLTGDFILVNKFSYGLRLPVLNTKVTEGTPPQRGDVMVFRYPPEPSMNYIKRVVGVPGDTVAYLNKRLTINGQPMNVQALPDFLYEENGSATYLKQFEETLGDKKHDMLNDESKPVYDMGYVRPFEGREGCVYTVEGFTCKVPPNHYFMMGDNRDNSTDSRYWGFVPDANIVGKAVLVWMNFGHMNRIGRFD